MKKYLLTLFCLLILRLQAAPLEAAEPIGQRFGMSLIEVIDSLHKEGLYEYSSNSGKPSDPAAFMNVRFFDKTGQRMLSYGFLKDTCQMATLVLPVAELDALVQGYDRKFTNMGKQIWRTPYGLMKVSVATGAESIRFDHKPHLLVRFDSFLGTN
jgi:hypothetical protein